MKTGDIMKVKIRKKTNNNKPSKTQHQTSIKHMKHSNPPGKEQRAAYRGTGAKFQFGDILLGNTQ